MTQDQHGNAVSSAGPDAIGEYDAAVDHLLHFRAEVVEATDNALRADPGFALAQAMQAYLGVLGTEPDDAATARDRLQDYLAAEAADLGRLLPRERMHLAAARALVAGDWYGGAGLLRDLVGQFPRDALALAIGHQCDFFTGDAATLRDRVGSALTAWQPGEPAYSKLLGMYAFGLEESGHYARAEDVGREAVERDPHDVWGVHAVVHTLEMQGRFSDGLGYLDKHAVDWQTGNFLNVHNWWHYCLYLLESGNSVEPLEIYDSVLHTAQSAGICMEMLDAAALLWRLYLEGSDQSPRWTVLADAWEPKMTVPHYAFNDMHAVMAYVGAGRFEQAQRLVDARTAWVAESGAPPVTNVAMTRDVGIPVCSALIAFGQERYADAVACLFPIRATVNRFGGSHAQRDAVQRTLVEAALRSGRYDIARSLLSERLGVNPCSPYSWLKQAAVADALGDAAAAGSARARAGALRAPAST